MSALIGCGRPAAAPWPAGAVTRPRQNNAPVKHRVARMLTRPLVSAPEGRPAPRDAVNSSRFLRGVTSAYPESLLATTKVGAKVVRRIGSIGASRRPVLPGLDTRRIQGRF